MNNIVKVNGEGSWVNNASPSNAFALFRVKIVEDWSAYYSYKSIDGVMVLRILKSSADENYYHDVMFRFSTKNATDKTSYVKIFDMDAEVFSGWSYKVIVKNDGYAYFYIKGSNNFEYYKAQILYATYPAFVEFLDGSNLITSAEYTTPTDTIQTVLPSRGVLDSGTVTANGSYAQISTATGFIPLAQKVIDGTLASLNGYVRLYSSCPKNTTFLTSTVKPTGSKPVIFYCDVYEGYSSEAEVDFDSTKVKRMPFVFNTDGTIAPLYNAVSPSYIFFNLIYKYR